MAFDYDIWLSTARDRLEFLYQQKAAIEEEISKLESGIEGFAPLSRQAFTFLGPEMGMTQAIRMILKSDPDRVRSAMEVRDDLVARGIQLTQNNPMATIHQILARLVEQGDAKTHLLRGKTCYQWTGEGERKRAERRAKRKVRYGDPGIGPPDLKGPDEK